MGQNRLVVDRHTSSRGADLAALRMIVNFTMSVHVRARNEGKLTRSGVLAGIMAGDSAMKIGAVFLFQTDRGAIAFEITEVSVAPTEECPTCSAFRNAYGDDEPDYSDDKIVERYNRKESGNA